MNGKYKIGDISKLLGIPVQTLRYYEEQGIVNPQKDEETGYRYYDAWDLNNLIDSVHYRALDFSINQTQEILNQDDLDSIRAKYEDQETILLRKIQEYRRMLDIVSRQRQKMAHFEDHMNRFDPARCPGLLFYRHRLKDSFQSKDGDNRIQTLKPGMQEWMDEIPNVTPTFMVTLLSLGKGAENLQYWWGWSLPIDDALTARMQVNEHNEYLPSNKCIYTVFEAKGKGTFAKSFCENVYNKIDSGTYTIIGNPIGRLIMKSHDQNGMHRYFEVWIPIEDV